MKRERASFDLNERGHVERREAARRPLARRATPYAAKGGDEARGVNLRAPGPVALATAPIVGLAADAGLAQQGSGVCLRVVAGHARTLPGRECARVDVAGGACFDSMRSL
jgi:hypothetical protein